ncbi:MAG: iron ABC transporter permease [Spirochaetales bacterium]|nr:iron ABC transporter permease [Spirochaetales bacterium]
MATATKPLWRTVRTGRWSFKLDRRALPVCSALILGAAAIFVVSVGYGEFDISALDVLRTILGMETDDARHRLVVWSFRMPRILVAYMVGAALAISGTIIQGVTRNPLADPGVLGVTAGASLAAVAAIVRFDMPIVWLPLAAFGGGVTVAFLVLVLARGGGNTPVRLILVGVGMAAVATAFTNLLIVFGEINRVQQATIWLAGSVYGRDWGHVRTIAIWLAVLVPPALLAARALNALALGDELATGLGLSVAGQRTALLVVSVALAAVAVSVAGTVGFVGLVAPHITRRLVGPSHEGLVPTSALTGGLLLMGADLIGRRVIAPSELPVGIVAAMIGAPYFAYLLYRTRGR